MPFSWAGAMQSMPCGGSPAKVNSKRQSRWRFLRIRGMAQGHSARVQLPDEQLRESRPLEYDGLEIVLVKFAGGALGKVSVNFDCIMPYTFPVEIFGDKGTFRDNRLWSHKFPGQKDWVTIPTILPDSADVAHHPFQGQIDHFVECLLSERESHCNLEDAIMTHEVVFAAQVCYRTGRPSGSRCLYPSHALHASSSRSQARPETRLSTKVRAFLAFARSCGRSPGARHSTMSGPPVKPPRFRFAITVEKFTIRYQA